MTAQNFPDKHQANSLPVRLGGKEGAEEFSFGLFTYPRTIVNDFDRSVGSGPYYYLTLLSVFSGIPLYTFGSILDDIHKHLLKKRSIHTHHSHLRVAFQT